MCQHLWSFNKFWRGRVSALWSSFLRGEIWRPSIGVGRGGADKKWNGPIMHCGNETNFCYLTFFFLLQTMQSAAWGTSEKLIIYWLRLEFDTNWLGTNCWEGEQEFITVAYVLFDMFSADCIWITSTNYRKMHQRATGLARVKILLLLKSLVSLLQHVVASFHRTMNGMMIGW